CCDLRLHFKVLVKTDNRIPSGERTRQSQSCPELTAQRPHCQCACFTCCCCPCWTRPVLSMQRQQKRQETAQRVSEVASTSQARQALSLQSPHGRRRERIPPRSSSDPTHPVA
ncbi:mCG140581, partial [Mus musculus]